MNQMNVDTKLLEERVSESEPTGEIYLKKGEYTIVIPWKLPFRDDSGERPYMELAAKLDHVIEMYYDLIGEENIHLQITNPGKNDGITSIKYLNVRHYMSFQNTSLQKHNNIQSDNIWLEMGKSPSLGRISYNQDNEIILTFVGPFNDMVKTLINSELDSIQEKENFGFFVEDINKAIDDLFVKQGFEPTPAKRHNLIDLYHNLPKRFLDKKEVQKLIGITPETFTPDNPNLIRLAAKGLTYTMVIIFCISGIFPDSEEDLEGLANIPIEMLYGIWSGQK